MVKKAVAEEQSGTQRASMPPSGALDKLWKLFENTKRKTGQLAQDYSTEVRSVEEKHHLHKRAWAQACRENKMTAEEVSLYLDHLDYYRDELGIYKRAESAPALNLNGADAEDADEATAH